MTFTRTIAVTLFLSLLLIYLTDSDQMEHINGVDRPRSSILDCATACTERCSESSRPNLCKRACGSCCGRCQCVPPGTSGNYEACPCYFNLTTHNNTRKCP